MWVPCNNKSWKALSLPANYIEAIINCTNLWENWRLPTKEELVWLYWASCKTEVNFPIAWHWSISEYERDTNYSWIVDMSTEKMIWLPKEYVWYTICVNW
jgi:hypothetical protein